MPTEHWKLSDKHYSLGLSRFRLGKIALQTAQYEKHFTTLPPRLDDSIIPLDELGKNVDVFVLRPQPIEVPIPVMTVLPKAVRYAPTQYLRSYADLSGTFEDYLKKFSPKTRKGVQRSIRQYNEYVGDEHPVRRFEGEAGIVEFHRLAREVAKTTYHEKLVGGGLPPGEDYLIQMRRLAVEGRARGYALMHGKRPVSYVYLVSHSGVVHLESTGYDPDYADFSPGRYLLYTAHHDLFEEKKYRLFDYGEQEGPHKQLFGTHHVLVAHVFYFMRRPKSLSVVAGQAGLHFLGRELKATLEKTRNEERARRLIGLARNRASSVDSSDRHAFGEPAWTTPTRVTTASGGVPASPVD
jgi:hypothetical protein